MDIYQSQYTAAEINAGINLANTAYQKPQGGIPASDLAGGVNTATVSAGAAISIAADNITVISGTVGTATITLQVPNDNNGHVWTFYMSTDSSVAITFATSDSGNIYVPDGFVIGASKRCEIVVSGANGNYYLKYGEFITAQ